MIVCFWVIDEIFMFFLLFLGIELKVYGMVIYLLVTY